MDCIEAYIEKNLTAKRKAHTYGVVETAVKLSRRFGEDEEKSKVAALYHDMFRSTPLNILNMYVRQLNLGEQYIDNANLSHGKIAAYIMKRDWNIKDTDILNAVKYHTTGRVAMSKLEKIIYLADAIEPGRSYPSVDLIRNAALHSLDKACLLSMEHSIEYIRTRGLFLHEDTINARRDLKEKEKQMECKEMAKLIANTLDNKKATDIIVIDIGSKSAFADYMILASGTGERQVSALCDEVEEKLEKKDVFVKNIEGKKSSGWILMDYEDIIVNLLTVDMREKYNIEKVWADCEFLNVED